MHSYLIIFVAAVSLNHLKELGLYNHKQYDICKSRPEINQKGSIQEPCIIQELHV